MVQQVVADVGGGSLHALDEDLALRHVKVVVEETSRVFGLPEKVFGHVSPEVCRRGQKDETDGPVAAGNLCLNLKSLNLNLNMFQLFSQHLEIKILKTKNLKCVCVVVESLHL